MGAVIGMNRQQAHEKTDKTIERVTRLAGRGFTHEDCADALGVSNATLWKYYTNEFRAGRAQAHSKIAKRLFDTAMGEGPGQDDRLAHDAAKFIAARRFGWSEKQQVEHSGGVDQQGGDAAVNAALNDVAAKLGLNEGDT